MMATEQLQFHLNQITERNHQQIRDISSQRTLHWLATPHASSAWPVRQASFGFDSFTRSTGSSVDAEPARERSTSRNMTETAIAMYMKFRNTEILSKTA